MHSSDEQANALSRREVIARLLAAGCTACLGGLASSCPGGSDWGKPHYGQSKHGSMDGMQPGGRLEIAQAEVPLGSVKEISLGGRPAFLVHYEKDGGEAWLAVENRCTHKQSKLDFLADGGYFKCPLHKSEYNIDGSLRERAGGRAWPAKEALQSWPVSLEGDMAVISMTEAGNTAAANGNAAMLDGNAAAVNGDAETEPDDDSGRGRGRGRGGD